MKNIIITLAISFFLYTGCREDKFSFGDIIGKWQLVKGYNLMAGGIYTVDPSDQRIESYTKNHISIQYDNLGNEISRCDFRATESVNTIYGVETIGTKWESSYAYWFEYDTLKIRHDGGFEYYDEYFVRFE